MWYIQVCLSTRYLTITHAPWRKHYFQAMFCSMRFVLVHIGTKWIAFTHAHCPLSRVIHLNLIYISTYLFIYLFIYSLFPIPSFCFMNTYVYGYVCWPFLLPRWTIVCKKKQHQQQQKTSKQNSSNYISLSGV